MDVISFSIKGWGSNLTCLEVYALKSECFDVQKTDIVTMLPNQVQCYPTVSIEETELCDTEERQGSYAHQLDCSLHILNHVFTTYLQPHFLV